MNARRGLLIALVTALALVAAACSSGSTDDTVVDAQGDAEEFVSTGGTLAGNDGCGSA